MNQNINDPRHPWSRLTAAARDAREASEGRDVSAPYGFATRIAALAFAQERRVASLFERFAFRAVGVSALLALFSVVLNYQDLSLPVSSSVAVTSPSEEVELVAVDDAVSIVLDFAD